MDESFDNKTKPEEPTQNEQENITGQSREQIPHILDDEPKRDWRELLGFHFGKDFSVGCLTLFAGALAIFFGALFIGILKVVLKVSIWLAFPIAAILILILFAVFLGRIVTILYKLLGQKKDQL